MARKDNKGRNLKTGESQRPDGRYMYRYKDELTGKRVTIYDMDLASLREQEKKINEDITYLEFDLTQLIGQSSVNLGIRTPSRTYRIVMTDLVVTVE